MKKKKKEGEEKVVMFKFKVTVKSVRSFEFPNR